MFFDSDVSNGEDVRVDDDVIREPALDERQHEHPHVHPVPQLCDVQLPRVSATSLRRILLDVPLLLASGLLQCLRCVDGLHPDLLSVVARMLKAKFNTLQRLHSASLPRARLPRATLSRAASTRVTLPSASLQHHAYLSHPASLWLPLDLTTDRSVHVPSSRLATSVQLCTACPQTLCDGHTYRVHADALSATGLHRLPNTDANYRNVLHHMPQVRLSYMTGVCLSAAWDERPAMSLFDP